MIRKDYILRMIQQIISAILEALLKKKRLEKQEMDKYEKIIPKLLETPMDELLLCSPDDLIQKYADRPQAEQTELLELAAVTLLILSEASEENNLLQQSRLRQNAVTLLEYLQEHSGTFSFEREALISSHR